MKLAEFIGAFHFGIDAWEQLRVAVNRHADRSPEEFFTRLLQEIHQFSKRDSFDDDVCIVGVQVRHTG